MRVSWLGLFGAAAIMVVACANAARAQPATAMREAARNGNWTLAARTALELDFSERSNVDVATQTLAFVGRDDLIASALARHGRGPSEQCATGRGGASRDAIAEIVSRAADMSVVVINEAHDHPLHRAFIARVVRALGTVGFDTYAAEALRFPTTALMQRGYVSVSDGYYTREPLFAQSLETAMQLGYELVGYEFSGPFPEGLSPSERADLRERRQAEQLYERTFGVRPSARLIVHVGYGHVRELPRGPDDSGPRIMMATHLKELLGRDILTIDQTACGIGPSSTSAPLRTFLRMDADGRPISDASRGVDLQVVHISAQSERPRPAWRFADGRRSRRIPRDVRIALEAHGEAVVVEARRLDRPADAVPEDRILWRPGDDVRLALRRGRYVISAMSADNTPIESANLEVMR